MNEQEIGLSKTLGTGVLGPDVARGMANACIEHNSYFALSSV